MSRSLSAGANDGENLWIFTALFFDPVSGHVEVHNSLRPIVKIL
ncbi:hypothetical protein LLB_2522 [Legionella longbeachae D-4968]|nr:hypothetical protein LLB_2522 [Legionella longbeachae D-4968]